MKCKSCKRELPENALYCCWCGQKQIKEKGHVSVPKPRKLKNCYTAQIMVHGERYTVSAPTESEYYQKATEIKTGVRAPAPTPTLKEAINNYIKANTETLSPSTLHGYNTIYKCRFKDYMPRKINEIDYQSMINAETKKYSPKSVKNAWGLVTASLNYAGMKCPKVNLAQVPESDLDYLKPDEIKKFLNVIKGDEAECAALLALHSLRRSELEKITAKDVTDGVIHVKGARIYDDAKRQWVDREVNKNKRSTRDIPIIIPRLLEVMPKTGKAVKYAPNALNNHIKKLCEDNGLTVVTLHDLRRTFASTAAYLKWSESAICSVGGWVPGSDVVHKVYIKVSNQEVTESAEIMKTFLNY